MPEVAAFSGDVGVLCESAGFIVPLTPGIELRHLRYFLAVYEELHFGRAAERLHIAQPPLSQAIRKLEEHLGVQLFDRTSRAVKPTAAGVVFAEEARTALANVEFAISEARRAGPGEMPLRIGFPTYVPNTRLQLLLDELRKRRAALRADVARLLALDQVDSLRSGRLDLGVLIHPEDHEGLEHEPVFPGERIEAFLAPDHPLSELDVLGPADVRSETLITFPRATNPLAYDRFQRRLEELGFRFKGIHTTVADLRDVLLAVAGGFGIAVGPSFAREFSSEGKLVVSRRLEPELRFPDLAVAWRKDPPRELRPKIDAVRAAAQEVYAATG